MQPRISSFLTAVNSAGCNLSGVASVGDWDAAMKPERRSAARMPGAQSILVVGSGGGALWNALLADLKKNPRHLTHEAHPLDAFVRRKIHEAEPLLGTSPRRWFWAAAEADVHIDFRLLGNLAGLGTQSRLGLLLNQRFGPWVGLRAACFLMEPIPASPAATSLCEGCPAPCVQACPGKAFPNGQWSVDQCSAFHNESTHCQASCDSRRACPVGASERYPDEEIAYHCNRKTGREWLRSHLGISKSDDQHEGVGPHWGSWRERVDVKG